MTLICPHHPFSLQLNVVPKSPTTMTSWILSLSFFVLLYCGQGFSITYEVSNYAVNWFEAQQFCLGRGTTMVKINNSTEQSAARDWLNQVDSGGSGLYWIGLTDIAREGTYVWTDGMQASYFSWYSGEPNDSDGSSDCIHMEYGSKNRQWTDSGCYSRNIYAFCQK